MLRTPPVDDVTQDFKQRLSVEMENARKLFLLLNENSPESISQAMGNISVKLVASYVGGRVVKHHNPGYDVVVGDDATEKIEVKSRRWMPPAPTTFPVRRSSEEADTVYFLLWYG